MVRHAASYGFLEVGPLRVDLIEGFQDKVQLILEEPLLWPVETLRPRSQLHLQMSNNERNSTSALQCNVKSLLPKRREELLSMQRS